MMIEVEVKVSINNIDLCVSEFLDKGFSREAYVEEIDTYYTSEFRDFRVTDEALRVRESKDLITGKGEAYITYKGKKLDNVSMSRLEHETKVGNGAIIKQILESIGFKPVPPVEKVRIELRRGNISACIDDVKGLGGFLELEILVQKEEQREEALTEIERTLKQLGLEMSNSITQSYLSMLEKIS